MGERDRGATGSGGCTPESFARANVINGRPIITPPRLIVGFDIPSRQRLSYAVYRETIVQGRYLQESDIGTLNAVVSQPIVDQFGLTLGEVFEVNGEEFTLVGVTETGSILLDVAIAIDESSMREICRFDEGTVNDFYVEPADGYTSEQMKFAIENLFVGRTLDRVRSPGLRSTGWRGVIEQLLAMLLGYEVAAPTTSIVATDEEADMQDSPVDVTSTSEFTGRAAELTGDLDFFLAMLTGIGVLIAVLSIVNTMLMSVAERTTEFGILRANGWSRGQIMRLITTESAVIGLIGGIFGAIAGYIGVETVNAQFPNKAHLFASTQLLVFAAVFSTIIGTLGGLYPAWRASRLNPIDAIRRV